MQRFFALFPQYLSKYNKTARRPFCTHKLYIESVVFLWWLIEPCTVLSLADVFIHHIADERAQVVAIMDFEFQTCQPFYRHGGSE